MRSSVLYFFLLVLEVSFDFTPDVVNECGGFSETLLEKCLEFVPSEESDLVPLNLSLVLLSAEVDPISEEQGCKEYALVARGTDCVEIIFALLTEVVAFHVPTPVIQVGVPGLEDSIPWGGIRLAMLLAFAK